MLLDVNQNMIIGVDVGGTNIRVASGDAQGNIDEKITQRTSLKGGLTIPKQIEAMINEVSGTKKIDSIGISSFGPLDMKGGTLNARHHIKKGKVPLVPYIKKKFKANTIILNDCVAAVIAEKSIGAGRKADNLAYITISTGIGAGIIVDGKILLGKDGNAHEVGHITIQKDGLKCSCGGLGHWESYTSGKGLPNFASHFFKRDLNLQSDQIYTQARENKSIKALIEEAGKINAIGIANVVNAYDPELITLGGSVALHNKDAVLKPILKNTKKHCINRVPKIMMTPLGHDACLKGALIATSNKP